MEAQVLTVDSQRAVVLKQAAEVFVCVAADIGFVDGKVQVVSLLQMDEAVHLETGAEDCGGIGVA